MSTEPFIVAYPFIGDEVGGSHISAIKLITALDPVRIRALIVLHQPDGVLAGYLREKGISYVVAPSDRVLTPRHRATGNKGPSTALDYVRCFPKLVRFLRQHGVSIVHTNDGQMHATWAVPTRVAGARLLWHHRGDPAARGVNILAPLFANQIVTVSRFSRPSRPIIAVDNKMTVLHSPFDHPAALPDRNACRMALVRELGLDDNVRFVGYFGSLNERKRPMLFVEIVAAYRKRYPGTPLHGLLFGKPEPGGPQLDLAVDETARKLDVSSFIHRMGFRSPVAPFMCAVDALLVPAVNEPFGRTLIEAMLLGTPVIATDHGGNPEAITNGINGYLVRPEDPEAFVEPLHRLLSNPGEWHRLSKSAREQALERYGVKAHVNGITEIYERMVGPTQSR